MPSIGAQGVIEKTRGEDCLTTCLRQGFGKAGKMDTDKPGAADAATDEKLKRSSVEADPHLTLTLSAPIGWERRGNS
jgi:hypothetical protein